MQRLRRWLIGIRIEIVQARIERDQAILQRLKGGQCHWPGCSKVVPPAIVLTPNAEVTGSPACPGRLD